jgi:hypothetical protein
MQMKNTKVLRFAVCFFIFTLSYVSYCFAVNNLKCVTLVGSGGCMSAGDTSCQTNGQVGAVCASCGGTSILQGKVCVTSEGNNCVASDTTYTCQTDGYVGNCVQSSGGVITCNLPQIPNDTCDSTPGYYCNN